MNCVNSLSDLEGFIFSIFVLKIEHKLFLSIIECYSHTNLFSRLQFCD